jgi:hypothetical protein
LATLEMPSKIGENHRTGYFFAALGYFRRQLGVVS